MVYFRYATNGNANEHANVWSCKYNRILVFCCFFVKQNLFDLSIFRIDLLNKYKLLTA